MPVSQHMRRGTEWLEGIDGLYGRQKVELLEAVTGFETKNRCELGFEPESPAPRIQGHPTLPPSPTEKSVVWLGRCDHADPSRCHLPAQGRLSLVHQLPGDCWAGTAAAGEGGVGVLSAHLLPNVPWLHYELPRWGWDRILYIGSTIQDRFVLLPAMLPMQPPGAVHGGRQRRASRHGAGAARELPAVLLAYFRRLEPRWHTRFSSPSVRMQHCQRSQLLRTILLQPRLRGTLL